MPIGRGKGAGAHQPVPPGGAKVYVGNLSWETSWQDLKDHMRQAGEVLHADIILNTDGRSKGCGLVTFVNAHDAAGAISTLHDSVLHGRSIFVREDREAALPGLPAPSAGRGAGAPVLPGVAASPARSAPPAVAAEPGSKVFVGNLAFETSWQDLKDHFRQAGEVLHADIMLGPDGRSKGCGLVTFASAHNAANAISSLNQTSIGGRSIFVREDREAALPGLPAPSAGRGAGAPAAPAAGGAAPAPPPFGGGLPPARSPPSSAPRPVGTPAREPTEGTAATAANGSKVYVGNLAWETSWQDLKDHFRQAGEVLHADIMLGPDGRSKGCGLVTFASAHDATNAISTLHDSVLHSRSIFVREDREPSAPAPGGFGGGKGGGRVGGATPTAGCQVFVGNLPWDVAWQALKDHFRAAGNVVHADVVMDADGRSRGFGTVLFATTREAAKAIQLFNETFLLGRQIEVRPDQHR